MKMSEAERVISEISNHEDWNVLTMERRAALELKTEPRLENQLQWLIEEDED